MAVCRGWGVYVCMYIMYVHFWHKIKFQVDLPMGPWPKYGSDFFLKLAYSTAFSPQILSNSIMPCAQLEYLREIRCHSIKKSVWNLWPMGTGPTLPSDFFLKMANCPVSLLILPLNYITMSSYFEYQVKSSNSFVTNSIWNFEVRQFFSFPRWLLLLA